MVHNDHFEFGNTTSMAFVSTSHCLLVVAAYLYLCWKDNVNVTYRRSQFCTDVWKEVVIIVESSFFVEEQHHRNRRVLFPLASNGNSRTLKHSNKSGMWCRQRTGSGSYNGTRNCRNHNNYHKAKTQSLLGRKSCVCKSWEVFERQMCFE